MNFWKGTFYARHERECGADFYSVANHCKEHKCEKGNCPLLGEEWATDKLIGLNGEMSYANMDLIFGGWIW